MTGTRHCDTCGRAGHDRRTCTVSLNASRCGHCSKQGHDKRNCPVLAATPPQCR